jgi:hypothetical protein
MTPQTFGSLAVAQSEKDRVRLSRNLRIALDAVSALGDCREITVPREASVDMVTAAVTEAKVDRATAISVWNAMVAAHE